MLGQGAASGFKVYGFGFRIWFLGLGFRVENLGFRVLGLGLWVQGLGSRVEGFEGLEIPLLVQGKLTRVTKPLLYGVLTQQIGFSAVM